MKLTDGQIEELHDLSRSMCAVNDTMELLEQLGLVTIVGKRFGRWAKITEAGLDIVRSTPVGVPGSAQAEFLLREVTARKHTSVTPNARVPAVSTPPAAAQDVGAPSPTGRIKLSSEQCDRVRSMYRDTTCSMAQLARHFGVSGPTIAKIIDFKYKPLEEYGKA